MRNAFHIVDRLDIDLEFVDPRLRRREEPELVAWIREELLEALDELFDEFADSTRYLVLEHLDIDLGKVDEGDFRIELPRRLKQELARHLRRAVETDPVAPLAPGSALDLPGTHAEGFPGSARIRRMSERELLGIVWWHSRTLAQLALLVLDATPSRTRQFEEEKVRFWTDVFASCMDPGSRSLREPDPIESGILWKQLTRTSLGGWNSLVEFHRSLVRGSDSSSPDTWNSKVASRSEPQRIQRMDGPGLSTLDSPEDSAGVQTPPSSKTDEYPLGYPEHHIATVQTKRLDSAHPPHAESDSDTGSRASTEPSSLMERNQSRPARLSEKAAEKRDLRDDFDRPDSVTHTSPPNPPASDIPPQEGASLRQLQIHPAMRELSEAEEFHNPTRNSLSVPGARSTRPNSGEPGNLVDSGTLDSPHGSPDTRSFAREGNPNKEHPKEFTPSLPRNPEASKNLASPDSSTLAPSSALAHEPLRRNPRGISPEMNQGSKTTRSGHSSETTQPEHPSETRTTKTNRNIDPTNLMPQGSSIHHDSAIIGAARTPSSADPYEPSSSPSRREEWTHPLPPPSGSVPPEMLASKETAHSSPNPDHDTEGENAFDEHTELRGRTEIRGTVIDGRDTESNLQQRHPTKDRLHSSESQAGNLGEESESGSPDQSQDTLDLSSRSRLHDSFPSTQQVGDQAPISDAGHSVINETTRTRPRNFFQEEFHTNLGSESRTDQITLTEKTRSGSTPESIERSEKLEPQPWIPATHSLPSDRSTEKPSPTIGDMDSLGERTGNLEPNPVSWHPGQNPAKSPDAVGSNRSPSHRSGKQNSTLAPNSLPPAGTNGTWTNLELEAPTPSRPESAPRTSSDHHDDSPPSTAPFPSNSSTAFDASEVSDDVPIKHSSPSDPLDEQQDLIEDFPSPSSPRNQDRGHDPEPGSSSQKPAETTIHSKSPLEDPHSNPQRCLSATQVVRPAHASPDIPISGMPKGSVPARFQQAPSSAPHAASESRPMQSESVSAENSPPPVSERRFDHVSIDSFAEGARDFPPTSGQVQQVNPPDEVAPRIHAVQSQNDLTADANCHDISEEHRASSQESRPSAVVQPLHLRPGTSGSDRQELESWIARIFSHNGHGTASVLLRVLRQIENPEAFLAATLAVLQEEGRLDRRNGKTQTASHADTPNKPINPDPQALKLEEFHVSSAEPSPRTLEPAERRATSAPSPNRSLLELSQELTTGLAHDTEHDENSQAFLAPIREALQNGSNLDLDDSALRRCAPLEFIPDHRKNHTSPEIPSSGTETVLALPSCNAARDVISGKLDDIPPAQDSSPSQERKERPKAIGRREEPFVPSNTTSEPAKQAGQGGATLGADNPSGLCGNETHATSHLGSKAHQETETSTTESDRNNARTRNSSSLLTKWQRDLESWITRIPAQHRQNLNATLVRYLQRIGNPKTFLEILRDALKSGVHPNLEELALRSRQETNSNLEASCTALASSQGRNESKDQNFGNNLRPETTSTPDSHRSTELTTDKIPGWQEELSPWLCRMPVTQQQILTEALARHLERVDHPRRFLDLVRQAFQSGASLDLEEFAHRSRSAIRSKPSEHTGSLTSTTDQTKSENQNFHESIRLDEAPGPDPTRTTESPDSISAWQEELSPWLSRMPVTQQQILTEALARHLERVDHPRLFLDLVRQAFQSGANLDLEEFALQSRSAIRSKPSEHTGSLTSTTDRTKSENQNFHESIRLDEAPRPDPTRTTESLDSIQDWREELSPWLGRMPVTQQQILTEALARHLERVDHPRRFLDLVRQAFQSGTNLDLEEISRRSGQNTQATSPEIAIPPSGSAPPFEEPDSTIYRGPLPGSSNPSSSTSIDAFLAAAMEHMEPSRRSILVDSIRQYMRKSTNTNQFLQTVRETLVRREPLDLEATLASCATTNAPAPSAPHGPPHGSSIETMEAAIRQAIPNDGAIALQCVAMVREIVSRFATDSELANLRRVAVQSAYRTLVHQKLPFTPRKLAEALLLDLHEALPRLEPRSIATMIQRRLGLPPFAPPPRATSSPFGPKRSVATPEGAPVRHAGLVLTAPYLPRLLGMLGHVTENAFPSDSHSSRALLTLHYLVAGHDDPENHDFALERVLCGLPPEFSLVDGIRLEQKEMETCDQLLGGIVQNWKALGKTSPQGLRETFLNRDGFLHLQDDSWHLRVPSRAFDVLIDRIPWGFSMIRFPWMERPLQTKWREA